MARLERPKGYSRELWKKLQNQIRNIKRFVPQKTKTGATVKNVPDVEDVYTPKGRKRIREWSAKKQWESTEYVQRETGEVVTGKEARRAWSEARREQRRIERQPEPEQVPEYDIYQNIRIELEKIPNERAVYNRTNKIFGNINTGGMRSQLLSMLDDIASDTDYLMSIEGKVASNVYAIQYASGQEDIYYAYEDLLTLLNGGRPLSLEQWNDLQDTALNY